MKKRKIALRNLALLTVLFTSFIACDKDFANIDSDIINNDNATHFRTGDTLYDVIAYTKQLDPVKSNDLPLNFLGFYDDPVNAYGGTSASFVTQIRGTIQDPDFGTGATIDSVVLTIPYFSIPTNITDEGITEYELDSIFGDDNGSFDLSIYESNYFLRDFDPTSAVIDSRQKYYANGSTGSSMISEAQLEGELLYFGNNFTPSASQITLTEIVDDEEVPSARLAPAMRIKFDDDLVNYWQEKIIDMAGEPELSNINNFNDYFRGLYFKAESDTDANTMMLLNMASTNANIIIYFTRDGFSEDSEPVQTTYTLNFIGNRVNFLSNDFSIPNGNETTGDENLFLKGGQGSIAEIKLFGGKDLDPTNLTDNTFEKFKKKFAEIDGDGKFIKSKELINEANLVFYVNQDLMEGVNEDEPNRIFLYDMNNNIALADYFFDTANTVFPQFSRSAHLVPLERENNEVDGAGIRYKIRITEHLNNLILRDSTNVRLGLAVSGNINIEASSAQFDLLDGSDDNTVPVSSILTPRGTILYGNTTGDEDKKLYLEIVFTEPTTNN
jgi:hypothetical protein